MGRDLREHDLFWYNICVEIPSDQKEIAATKRLEFDDLQNEIAGRETGRRARFLKDGPGSEEAKKKERDAQHRALTRLAQLLNDPVYRAKYDGVLRLLSDAEQATEATIDQLNSQVYVAQSELDDMMNNAARLPDGTRVFRDADGVVRREDGFVVEDHLAETIIWTGNEPSFEEVQNAKVRLDDLQAALDAANGYQNDMLGPARDRISDPDNPPSLDDLNDIENDIQSKMPRVVQEHLSQTETAAPDVATQGIGLPKLGG